MSLMSSRSTFNSRIAPERPRGTEMVLGAAAPREEEYNLPKAGDRAG